MNLENYYACFDSVIPSRICDNIIQDAETRTTETAITGGFNEGFDTGLLNFASDYNQRRFGFMRAEGGPVKGGSSYIVGERGPEMFTPGVSGMITPNHAMGGSTNINVNVDASGSSVEGDETQAEQLGQAISQAIQAELIQQQRPGGLLYS